MGKNKKYKKPRRKNRENITKSRKIVHETTEIINKLISESK